MGIPVCSIVSPHLLDALATSDDPKAREMALNTLAHASHVQAGRKRHFHAKRVALEHSSRHTVVPQGIVPDQMLEHVVGSAQADEPSRELAQGTLDIKQRLQDGQLADSSGAANVTDSQTMRRQIHDMQNIVQMDGRYDMTYNALPGILVRSEGEVPVPDEQVNQAYDNCAKVIEFYRQVFDYTFLDDKTAPIISSVHFENGFQNALWVGDSTRQMIYGDGGHDLYSFTSCLDIIGHEMTHAVTEHTIHLQYEGESGALNEHISDVFGKMVELWAEKKTTAESDWLIGEGCLKPGVAGVALRNMKFPGTAYDDPKFGKDPQPASWAEIQAYKGKHKYWATYDHGCVHAFSGVPSRAFVLVAEALGGYCWERAGKIWWSTMRSHRISPTCSFVEYADATVDVAKELFGDDVGKIVRNAWDEVGVKRPVA